MEAWVREVIERFEREEFTGPLTLHFHRGTIGTIEPKIKITEARYANKSMDDLLSS